MVMTLSGMDEVIDGLEDFEELIAREGIAIRVMIMAIINVDAATAKILFMT